jgi:hypothetical protein
MTPLNPKLCDALHRVFGNVGISNPGETRQVHHAPDWHGKLRIRTRTIRSGEQYRVNCPFCNDTRGRLYVSYQYGERDPQTGYPDYGLWCCFNEGCHKSRANRDWLKTRLLPHLLQPRKHPLAIPAVKASSPRPTIKRAQREGIAPLGVNIALPQFMTPVDQLPAQHPAAAYLDSRNFDRKELSERWQVTYCDFSITTTPRFSDRIVVPIYRDLEILWQPTTSPALPRTFLVGWIARSLGEPQDGYPKYLMCKGMRKSEVLYGETHLAATSGPIVVCEGPTDVWRLQTNAVALIGKTISSAQAGLLADQRFGHRPVVVLLDNDAKEDAARVQDAIVQARKAQAAYGPVVIAHLPESSDDPASCSREQVMESVQKAIETLPPYQTPPTYLPGTPS